MKRGAVIIGVDQYNDSSLPNLQAAVRGAKDVAAWAETNGFEVKPLTDEANPVTFERVQEAIENFTSRTGDQRLEQLLVYFSGHGINRGFDETWLLSRAIRNQNEAVNLASTVDMARYTTGISHIVFVSDACRSAADTIDLHNIVGGMAIVGKLKPQLRTTFRADKRR
jgi:Caspase domain